MAWVCREGSIHSLCWGKLLKAVPGLLTIGNVGKVKGRVFRAERTTSSNAPAGESAWCVWVGVDGYRLLDKQTVDIRAGDSRSPQLLG